MSIETVLAAVAERQRDHAQGASERTPEQWLAVLGSAVGRACDGTLLGHPAQLRTDLVDIAAVCGAWAEALGVAPAAWTERVAHLASREPQTTPLANLLTEVGWMAMDATLAVPNVGALVHGLAHMAATAVAWAAALEP